MNFTDEPDTLLDHHPRVQVLSMEHAPLSSGSHTEKAGQRTLLAQYKWNTRGQLVYRFKEGSIIHNAYNNLGQNTVRYTVHHEPPEKPPSSIIKKELFEYNDNNRLTRSITQYPQKPEKPDQITSYSYDQNGQVCSIQKEGSLHVIKTSPAGNILQEYQKSSNSPDLVKQYTYDSSRHLTSIVIKDINGTTHRTIRYTRDSQHPDRLQSRTIVNARNITVLDEEYTYDGEYLGLWLKRTTWIPTGKRSKKRRPADVIYRSFSLYTENPETPEPQQTLAFTNGLYTGQTFHGKPHGKGTFRFNDQGTYQGEFSQGHMSGAGELTWPDGRTLTGHFDKGTLNGPGTCQWPDGRVYRGPFHNGTMHGTGTLTLPDGRELAAEFKNGTLIG